LMYPSATSDESLDVHMMRRRRPFFLLLTCYVLVTALFSWILFDEDLTLISAIIRLPAIAILVTLAFTESRRLHLVLGLMLLALQLWFTYLFTFIVATGPAAG
ncbi:MAG: hypothetical protein MUO39_12080, partial [Steroidobacteraceae bacterium]|nr:hypothetical protein [Steroidobacteraceae bacterium]